MATKQRCGLCNYTGYLALAAVLAICGGVFAAEKDQSGELTKYRFFQLKHITARQGRRYLGEAGVGTVSLHPKPNTLLVTGKASEMKKADSILKLVDSPHPFVIKALGPALQVGNIPDSNQITAELGDITVGTFRNPPPQGVGEEGNSAIIDVHNGTIFVIAPAEHLDRILKAIDKVQQEPVPSVAQPSGPNEPNIFAEVAQIPRPKGVIGAELDKITASLESGQTASTAEKAEPEDLFGKVARSLPEPTPPVEVKTTPSPTGQPEAPAEQQPIGIARPQNKELSAILQRLEELEAIVKGEPSPEQMPAVVEEPNRPSAVTAPVRTYEPPPIPQGDAMLEVQLPEKLPLVDLLGLVGEYLGLDYMYDPANVKGDVVLKLHGKLRGKVRVKDLYPLLQNVLKSKNLVMTRAGNFVTIVPKGQELDADPVLIYDSKGQVQYGDVVVSRIFHLKHIDVASAKNLLAGMKLGININDSMAQAGTIIVTDYAHRMDRVETLLRMVDVPGEKKQFRFRQLKYTMAKNLATKVKSLAEQLGTISITVSAPPKARTTTGRTSRTTTRRPTTTTAKPTTTPKPTRESVYIEADERTNRILMIGLKHQLDLVSSLIDTLDVAQQDLRSLRLYEIQYVGADEVQQKLQELGIISRSRTTSRTPTSRGRITSQPGQTRTTTPQTTRTITATATGTTTAGGALAEEPQVVIIEATNSLLVNATPEQHAQIATIIGYVDSETLEQAIPYEIYPLENQKPSELAQVLEKLVQETIKDETGKVERTIRRREEDIVIVPDDNTFSLIVYASHKNQKWISKLIKTLDKRRPQVLIDVTLVEVSRTDLFDLDLQLASKFPRMEAGGTMDVVGAITTPFLSKKSKEVYSAPKFGPAQGFYSDDRIQALLTAMQTKNYGRVLAKPKILVNDGQPGTIKTTDTTNVKIEDLVVPQQGNAQISTRFQSYQAGITLTITPNISEGDLLLLDIMLDRTDFGETPEAGSPPNTTSSNITTTVTVPNGRTIILGGLVKLNQVKGGTKVPLLGDVPIIGGLFRSTSNTDRESKLYIFVKANILRPADTLAGLPELERISERNRQAFESFEEQFQSYEDWPGIKPKPMEPLKVLDAE